MKRRVFDVEADGLLDTITVLHSICIHDIDTGQEWSCHDHWGPGDTGPTIADGLRILEESDLLIGHNILDYDMKAIQKVHPTFSYRGRVRDTLLITRLIWTDIETDDFLRAKRDPNWPSRCNGAHSLEAWGFRVGVLKGGFRDHGDFSHWTPEMQTYCEQDVRVNVALWKSIEARNYSEEAIQLEHDFAPIIYDMCSDGWLFDEARAAKFYAELLTKREEINAKLQAAFPPRIEEMKTRAYWVDEEGRNYPTKGDAQRAKAKTITPGPFKTKTIPFNPASDDHVAERLQGLGWKPTQKTDTGKVKVSEDVLSFLPYPEAKQLVDLALIDKRIGQLATGKKAWMKNTVNGRIHPRVIPNGTVTGRCKHSGITSVPRVVTKKNAEGVEEVVWGFDGDYGADMRALFVADPGMLLVGADASGIEARCLAHYLARYDGGKYIEAVLHGDVHVMNRDAFGLPPTKEGRGIAKTAFYGWCYGAGPEKTGSVLKALEPAHESAAQREAVPAWALNHMVKDGPITAVRKANWLRGNYSANRLKRNIAGFAELIEAVKAVATKGSIGSLDGRRIRIRSAHSAINSVLQAAAAVLMKYAIVEQKRVLLAQGIERPHQYKHLGMYHDELQTSCRPEIADLVGKTFISSLKAAGEHFKFRCPLDGEYKIGKNWQETH